MRGSYREAWASVTGNRNLRLAQSSSLLAWTGEFLFLSAMTVYAFDEDGAAGVGLVGFLRVLPATVALPWLGALADRVSRRRLLVVACALRAVTAAGAAAAAAQPAAVYTLLTLSTVCHAAYRPVLAALFPTLCTTPEELTGVNAVRAVLDGAAALVGPLAAAALIAAYDPAIAFAAVALLAGAAGLLAAGLRYESPRPVAADGPPDRSGVVADVVEGLRELRRRGRALEVIGLGGAQCLVRGALTVLAVVVAVQLTDLGRPGVGVLWAAFGVGGLAAAMASIGAAGSARLGTLFGAGIALWGVPIVLVGLLTGSPVAVGAFVVIGAANALVDVTGFTLLQRLVPDQTLARVLALTEAVFSLTVALGSLAVPFVLSALGDTGALLAIGGILPVAVMARWAALRAIDADIGVRRDRIVLLRRVGMFRLLSVPVIESLAQRLGRTRVPAQTDVFRQGDPGDGFYVIESGRVAVLDDGQEIRQLGPGDAFGEIALLRAVPRTATVRALEDTELATLSGPQFVSAVTGSSAPSSAAERVVSDHLADDQQRHAEPPRTDPDGAPDPH
ncbi:cyclic nucleotide-binding domain-containing protein [Modestobacter altitudinis]|uniref:cyclic nucleotide-binding domain-containing protein n=1 Tax=Modestobacter altitudinis TaxID=2213158 RepID=UPI00110D215D|nr:cyclic nucleotide-binding domain-containing protein [Modestobacter altitudinis]